MTKTKNIILIVTLVLVLLVATAVKLLFFPSVKDAYFAMNQRNLESVPVGLVAIRPTHFSRSVFHRGIMYATTHNAVRIMGRNVPLRTVIAVAWQEDAARVQMPLDAPTNNFDFIVTLREKEPLKHLQRVICRQFGYVVQKETNDTDVLAMKVIDPALPGLTVSTPGEKQDENFKNGKVYFTRMRLKELASGFERLLKTPVMDETGLTNDYDCSLDWSQQLLARLENEKTARSATDKILNDWGLGLEPDTAPIAMLVVKKVY
jgi:uncharacterized protein (TIGR03435 family)